MKTATAKLWLASRPLVGRSVADWQAGLLPPPPACYRYVLLYSTWHTRITVSETSDQRAGKQTRSATQRRADPGWRASPTAQ
eukprot:2227232-Prymnesium_polylepis.1